MKLILAMLAATVGWAATFTAGFLVVDKVTPRHGIHDDSAIAVIALVGGVGLCIVAFWVWYRVFNWACDRLKENQ